MNVNLSLRFDQTYMYYNSDMEFYVGFGDKIYYLDNQRYQKYIHMPIIFNLSSNSRIFLKHQYCPIDNNI